LLTSIPAGVDPKSEAKLHVRSTVSADRRSVELVVSLAIDDLRVAYREQVADGRALVVDLAKLDRARFEPKRDRRSPAEPSATSAGLGTDRPKQEPQYVILAPQILVIEEEEERLSESPSAAERPGKLAKSRQIHPGATE
jgi:hypothetical protein